VGIRNGSRSRQRHNHYHHHEHHHRHTADSLRCPACPENVYPLSQAECHTCLRLVAVSGGYRLRRRLAELGLNPGSELRVVRSNSGGPLILAVKKDTRLAIGRGMADRILVEPAPESSES
jgi:ferrous iron transport protein A